MKKKKCSLRELLLKGGSQQRGKQPTSTSQSLSQESGPSLKEKLISDQGSFSFYQAARLLELFFCEQNWIGEDPEAKIEPVRLSSHIGVDFPSSDSQIVVEKDEEGEEMIQLVTGALGMAGLSGPLPKVYSELVLERQLHKDKAFKAFLDIFNHRLLSLLYRIRKQHRIGFEWISPEKGRLADRLFSLMGLGTAHLRDRMKIPDRSFIQFAGLLSQKPASMDGFCHLVSSFFQVKTEGKQFLGKWLHLAEDQWSFLGGKRAQNQCLGKSVVLGQKSWGMGRHFAMILGPMSEKQFLSFLPKEKGYIELLQLERFYLGDHHSWEVRLLVIQDTISQAMISSRKEPARLGWTSWLAFPGKSTAGIAPLEVRLNIARGEV